MENTYWVHKGERLLELRQIRFKEMFLRGQEHPWDLCAVVRDREELESMNRAVNLKGGIDWSGIESL